MKRLTLYALSLGEEVDVLDDTVVECVPQNRRPSASYRSGWNASKMKLGLF
jgi:hypothetical protein